MEKIKYEDFAKIDLVIGEIKEAKKVEGSDKLIKLVIDVGEETRTILAGIGKKYKPLNLIGKQVVVLSNIEPKKIMGIESEGMILAVDSVDGPILIVPHKKVSPGSKIK
jgi:methionine--tRNA ligase beta chain